MSESHAERMLRTARSLRASLLRVLEYADQLCRLIEGGPPMGPTGPPERPPDTRPPIRVDRETLTVAWAGRNCYLGHTLPFRLLERLAQRPNFYVPMGQLMDDLWAATRAPSTIRSALSVLRSKLRAAGMGDLASLVDGSNSGYVGLMLSRSTPNQAPNPPQSSSKPTPVGETALVVRPRRQARARSR